MIPLQMVSHRKIIHNNADREVATSTKEVS